jgi:hypothetical protein
MTRMCLPLTATGLRLLLPLKAEVKSARAATRRNGAFLLVTGSRRLIH